MPIYKQITEITNIDDLLSGVERDIEEVYFGDKNVFTVWGEYDGTLPAQYNANGSVLADYRIYGADGGVGDRTENLFDKNAKDTGKGYVNNKVLRTDGTTPTTSGEGNYFITEYTQISGGTLTCINNHASNVAALCLYDENKNYISGFVNNGTKTVGIPSGAKYIRATIYKYNLSSAMIVLGSTAPASYVPYGYEVDMSVSDGTTSNTTPIYIGDDPLGEGEYVDYGEQKVYRMVNGVLTPTDPPVPLPALPTVDGTNIVDYAGQSAAVPSRFYAKYRKEGF